MKRQRASLGDLCSLVKGTSPISKTSPGPYPLVTTGEVHRTSESFQLDAEAVCIPLISSTGHGHASLKRIHHQCGKFALANLLAAALVKDKSVLSSMFLARYLSFTKDRLIVPLMTGAANMSISVDRLATVPIEFPPLAEQERIVKLLDEADKLRTLRAQADRRTAALIPAIFHEMFGDPTKVSSRWPVLPLGEIVNFGSGATPSKGTEEYWKGAIPWISPKDMKPEEIVDAEDHVSESVFEKSNLQLFPKDTVLIVVRGMILAHTVPIRLCRVPFSINQDMKALLPKQAIHADFLRWALQAQHAHILRKVSTAGHGTKKLDSDKLKAEVIPVPPLKLQQEFAERVTETRAMQTAQAASHRRLDELLESMLHGAFRGELPQTESRAARSVAAAKQPAVSPATRDFARAVLSAEIVHQLHTEPTFGRVKHQKIFHLCEYIAELPQIAGQYHREAAGPLDSKLIYTNEAELKKQRWYEEFPRQKYGHAYRPLEKAGVHREYAMQYWPKQLAIIGKLIVLMRSWDTKRCEIFSTTYAAWNDLVIAGREPTADAIVHEVLENWHASKKRIPEARWREMIQWIRKAGFIPTGFGRPTHHNSSETVLSRGREAAD
jgi:type I restriction enzyme S subunit